MDKVEFWTSYRPWSSNPNPKWQVYYWQINYWQISEAWADLWKAHPTKINEYLISCVQIRGMSWTDFWKTRPYFCLAHAPIFYKNWIGAHIQWRPIDGWIYFDKWQQTINIFKSFNAEFLEFGLTHPNYEGVFWSCRFQANETVMRQFSQIWRTLKLWVQKLCSWTSSFFLSRNQRPKKCFIDNFRQSVLSPICQPVCYYFLLIDF